MKPETRISRDIVKALNKMPGVWAYKTHGSTMQHAGLPDVIACAYGKFLGLEVKRPETRGDTTPLQELVLQKIRDAWGEASVVTSIEEAVMIAKAYDRSGLMSS